MGIGISADPHFFLAKPQKRQRLRTIEQLFCAHAFVDLTSTSAYDIVKLQKVVSSELAV
jgi:hypothetical protein